MPPENPRQNRVLMHVGKITGMKGVLVVHEPVLWLRAVRVNLPWAATHRRHHDIVVATTALDHLGTGAKL